MPCAVWLGVLVHVLFADLVSRAVCVLCVFCVLCVLCVRAEFC